MSEPWPNKAAPGNGAMTLRLHVAGPWGAVPEQVRWIANNMNALRASFLGVALCIGSCLLSGCATCGHNSSTAPTAATEQGTGLLDWLFGDGSGLENIWTDSYGNLRSH